MTYNGEKGGIKDMVLRGEGGIKKGRRGESKT